MRSVIQSEHPLHHGPFLIGGYFWRTALKTRHERFPFSLTRHLCKPCHGAVPVEIRRCLNNHNHMTACDVHLHFQNANSTYAVAYLLPVLIFAMTFPVEPDELRIVLYFKELTVAFHRAFVPAHSVAFCFHGLSLRISQEYGTLSPGLQPIPQAPHLPLQALPPGLSARPQGSCHAADNGLQH